MKYALIFGDTMEDGLFWQEFDTFVEAEAYIRGCKKHWAWDLEKYRIIKFQTVYQS